MPQQQGAGPLTDAAIVAAAEAAGVTAVKRASLRRKWCSVVRSALSYKAEQATSWQDFEADRYGSSAHLRRHLPKEDKIDASWMSLNRGHLKQVVITLSA